MNGRNEALYGYQATVTKKGGGVRPRAVRALLRKGRQEQRSQFKAGQFDLLGFLLQFALVAAIVALFVIFFGQFTEVYISVKTAGTYDVYARAAELLTILYAAVIVGSIIFMALILPAWFWWLVCGCLLLCGGIWLLRL